MAMDFIRHPQEDIMKDVHKQIIYRHLASITALRYQLREKRQWENARINPQYIEYRQRYKVLEWDTPLDEEIAAFLPEKRMATGKRKKNAATQIMACNRRPYRELFEQGMITELKYIEMQQLIKELYEHQGGCERIKNFPYPRQYSSISRLFFAILTVLIPLGMLNEFAKLGPNFCMVEYSLQHNS